MNAPRSPAASSYAGGPSSPIASSKRPRALRPDIKSPSKATSSSIPSLPSLESSKNAKAPADAARAGGVLFSPNLQEDGSEKKENGKKEETETSDDVGEENNEMDQENGDESDDDVFNPYLFIATLPPHTAVAIQGKICLPPQPKFRRTLVLDLDETLVHCSVDPIETPDLTFPVTFNGKYYQVYVRKRPYLDYFLETVTKNFEVVIFTASQKVYADVLLDLLDPAKKLISHRLFRDSCLFVQGNFLKDMSVLARDMKKTMLVDNSPHAYGYNLENGIPIESWFDDQNDTELLKLLSFLKNIEMEEDVRPVIKNHFKSHELVRKARLGQPQPATAPPFELKP